uniref:Uncharacterized protein n=1 Tax=Rhizophora mucronata TaxID=61149 RepID=A0A2P2IUY5_RHIMU
MYLKDLILFVHILLSVNSIFCCILQPSCEFSLSAFHVGRLILLVKAGVVWYLVIFLTKKCLGALL